MAVVEAEAEVVEVAEVKVTDLLHSTTNISPSSVKCFAEKPVTKQQT